MHSDTGEGGAPVPQDEFKKSRRKSEQSNSEGNTKGYFQVQSQQCMYVYMMKKGKNKHIHMKMHNTPNEGTQHKRRPW